MAPVIIIVAVVFVVAVTPPLGHSDCRRKRERQNCGRTGAKPRLE
jgi:hypothetical protein